MLCSLSPVTCRLIPVIASCSPVPPLTSPVHLFFLLPLPFTCSSSSSSYLLSSLLFTTCPVLHSPFYVPVPELYFLPSVIFISCILLCILCTPLLPLLLCTVYYIFICLFILCWFLPCVFSFFSLVLAIFINFFFYYLSLFSLEFILLSLPFNDLFFKRLNYVLN